MTARAAASRYVQDILGQPQRLHDLATIRPWRAADERIVRAHERTVLTGMGASLFALLPLWQQLVRAGRPAWLVETGELMHACDGLVSDDTLLIAASQSGYSAEVVALTERRPVGSTLVGITNDPASPLGLSAEVTIEIHSGEERAVSTRSYLNTVGAAAGLGVQLLGDGDPAASLHAAADAVAAYLGTWDERLQRAVEAVALPDRLYIVGRGASLAAARCGALVVKEAAKWPAEAMSAGQFRHGPLELADDRLTVLVLAGHTVEDRHRNRQLADDVRRFGGTAVWVDAGIDPPVPELEIASTRDGLGLSLAEMVGLQLASVGIAQLAGVEAGVFRHLEKVQTVE